MIGSFDGEGGELCFVLGRVEDHLNMRSMKMADKIAKTKGFRKKEVVTCCPKNCRKLDIFLSISRVAKYISIYGLFEVKL